MPGGRRSLFGRGPGAGGNVLMAPSHGIRIRDVRKAYGTVVGLRHAPGDGGPQPGGPPARRLRAGDLAQIRAAVLSGALFAFITSFDEVVVGLFVAGGDNTVLTRRMFVALRDALDPTIAAISTCFIVLSLVGFGAASLFRVRR